MKELALILPTSLSQARANALRPPSSDRPRSSVTLTHDIAGRKELTNFLFQCFDAMKVYGKEPEQMENLNSVFQIALADYSFAEIRSAFVHYIKNHPDLPAPADIVSLIERKNRPPLDRAVYVQIGKKPGERRTVEEWQYMDDYEHFQLNGKHRR